MLIGTSGMYHHSIFYLSSWGHPRVILGLSWGFLGFKPQDEPRITLSKPQDQKIHIYALLNSI